MADKKISELSALTTPAAGDLIPIVRISEPLAANKNMYITYDNLGAFVFSYSVVVAPAARDVGNYTFTPPTGATCVLVRMSAKWSEASDNNLLVGRDSAGGNVTAVVRASIANIFMDGMGVIPVVGGVCNYSVAGANALSTTISMLGYWR